jgi:hypothetical protein
MIKTSILFNDKKYPVDFFNDDTIEIVQQQISRSIDIHPDRLYILVGLHYLIYHYFLVHMFFIVIINLIY